MEMTMSRIFKIASLINCKLKNTSANHNNLLLVNTVFSIGKNKNSSNTIFGDLTHYKRVFENEEMRKKDLENQISHTLKRHNGFRLVLLNDSQYALICPKKSVTKLGLVRSCALATWYRFWNQKNKK